MQIDDGSHWQMDMGATEDQSSRAPWWRQPDAMAVAILLGLTAVMMWHRWVFDNWLARHDMLTFFLPWFGALGDRLADLDVPALNPSIFSGAPFAGDPESGWMYFPAMLLFPFFEVTVAYKLMILVLLVLAGTSTYGLSRLLGYHVLAALFTAVAFEFGPFLFGQTDCCTVGTQMGAFMPLAFLGVELAVRAPTWPLRLAAWSLGGLAVSQMFAAWLGQGIVNALLLLAAWAVFRTVITPPDPDWGKWQRLTNMVWTGAGVIGTGVLLGAAGILPRLQANAESNNPGGTYEHTPRSVDGDYHTLASILRSLVVDLHGYRGSSVWGVVFLLMVAAVFLARRRSVIPFFAISTVLMAAIAVGVPVITDLFYLIPRYEELQIHRPGRIIWVMPFVLAMLAGGAVNELPRLPTLRWKWAVAIVPMAIVAGVGWIVKNDGAGTYELGRWTWTGAILATLVLVALCATPARLGAVARQRWINGAIVTLVVLAFVLPNGLDLVNMLRRDDPPPGQLQMWGNDPWMQGLIEESLSQTDPGGAGEFLQERMANGERFRFVAYGGMYHPETIRKTYPDRRLEPAMVHILQNERPMRLGLETTQGYNPQEPLVYQEFMAVLNRGEQDYHFASLLNTGVNSPLLDLLSVRYMVVDRTIPETRDDIQALAEARTEVYRDDNVIIYESPTAMERAWMVYDVRQGEGLAGIAAIDRGEVNGAEVAFVEDAPPPLTLPAAGESPKVTVTGWSPDSRSWDVSHTGEGLLVVSEVYSENWQATVDGEEVEVLQTDHALLGIPLGPGEHTVKLHYQPMSLVIGLWVSGLTGLAMLGTLGLAGWSLLPYRRREPTGVAFRRTRLRDRVRRVWPHRMRWSGAP
jgi:hypothetical protein